MTAQRDRLHARATDPCSASFLASGLAFRSVGRALAVCPGSRRRRPARPVAGAAHAKAEAEPGTAAAGTCRRGARRRPTSSNPSPRWRSGRWSSSSSCLLRPRQVRLEAAARRPCTSARSTSSTVLLETEQARNESEQLLAEHRRLMAQAADQVRAMLDEAQQGRPGHAPTRSSRRPRPRPRPPATGPSARSRTARDQALAEIWTKTADLAVSVAGKVLSKQLDRGRPSPPGRRWRSSELPARRRPTATEVHAHERRHRRPPGRRPGPSSTTRRPSWPGATPRPCSTPPTSEGQVEAVLDELDAIGADVLQAHPEVRRDARLARSRRADKDRILVEVVRGPGSADGRSGSSGCSTATAGSACSRRSPARPGRSGTAGRTAARSTVRSAVPLDEGQQAALRDRLAALIARDPDPARSRSTRR